MMDLGNGLAGGMAAPQEAGISVEDVVAMLMEGISPEKLVEQGVPVELIKQAIQVLMQEQGGSMAPSQPTGGLAASMV